VQQQLKKANTSDDEITAFTLAVVSESQDREQIAALAYALWQERGCPEGTPDEDWLRAEREIGGSKRIDEEAESRDSAERSIDTETADPSLLRFPVGSEVSQAANAGASRRG
jgi:hypothetical protein